MSIWIERLRPTDLQLLLPQVLLTLDRLRDQPTDPERRLAVLRSIKDQVEAIQTALPTPRPKSGARASGARTGERIRERIRDRSAPGRPTHVLTLEQRLTRSWCNSLQALLVDLGQPRYGRNARYAVYREWTLRQLLKGFAQAVEYAVQTEQDPPAGTWRALHELFVYLDGRDELDGPPGSARWRFDPGLEYKRLLLLGILGQCTDAPRVLPEAGQKLFVWAAESVLRRGESVVGETHLLRVDVTRDAPPAGHCEGVEEPYRGWLLDPPKAFRDCLEGYRPAAPQPRAERSTEKV